MARPNRNTSDAFYDVFTDMPFAEQKIAMRILEQIHRQADRDEKARKPEPLAPPPAPPPAEPPSNPDECGA